MALTTEDLQAIENLFDKKLNNLFDKKLKDYIEPEFIQLNHKIDKLQNEFHAVFRLDENELRISSGNE